MKINLKKMDIKWAPLNVPMQRRLQTLAAAFWMLIVIFGEMFSLIIIFQLLYSGNILLRTIVLIYLLFIWYDRDAKHNGSRRQGSEWFRGLTIWRYYCDYFPVKLIKTCDLPANRNYIFAQFPHGLLCTSAFASYTTPHIGFKELFPGIRSKITTLPYHFNIPIFRELILSWGIVEVSAKSIITLITKPNDPKHSYNNDGYTSNAAVIMVGGADEAFNLKPNVYRLILKNRKGFIKLALRYGTPVVPCFAFGENDIFDQVETKPGSFMDKYQHFIKKITGVAPIKFIGRGFFQYSYGLIPRRLPLYNVVGEPIDLPKIDNPTNEELDKYHDIFISKLNELFEENKLKYIKNSENLHLIID